MLAAFGVAIAAALFLKVLPPLIVLVFFIGGIAAVNLRLRRKVKDERKGFASEALGLKVEREDPFGLTGYPFALFSRCEAGSIEDVRWGTWRGLEVKRFDLACATRAGEQVRFGCAIGPSHRRPCRWSSRRRCGGPCSAIRRSTPSTSERPTASAATRFGAPIRGSRARSWVPRCSGGWAASTSRGGSRSTDPSRWSTVRRPGVEGPLERLHAFVNLAGRR